jgi:hypothetical protein
MKSVALVAALTILSGCVTPTVTKQTAQPVDFSKFKSITYRVHASEAIEYADGPDGFRYGQDTMALIDSLLSARLARMGYKVVSRADEHDLEVDVSLTAAKPGSRAARIWVGFGAGRAITLFDARFMGSDGAVLTSFQGGRSFSGMELNVSPWAGNSDISASAATRCVDQIETFMTNRGAFPGQARR